MKALAHYLTKYRIPVITLIAIVTVVAGWFLKDLRINADVVSYFPDRDPAVRLFKKLGASYCGTSLAIVAVEADDVFAPEVLRDIAKLTESFKTVPGVLYVTSLTNIIDIRSDHEGIVIGRLIDAHDLANTPEQTGQIKKYTMSKRMIRGRIVSEDARITLILCRIEDRADDMTVAKSILQTVEASGITEKTYFAGFPFQMYHITKIILDDLKTLVPVAAVVVIISLFIGFRSFTGVFLPLLTVIISSVWTLGLMAALDIPLTIISDVLPVILIAVGSAYGIHVVNKYKETEDDLPESRMHATMTIVGVSVMLAGLTTMIGFLSFIFGSYLVLIKDFGVFSSLGIMFALVISLTLVPALLTFTKGGSKAGEKDKQSLKPHKHLTPIAEFVCRHSNAVFFTGMLIALACGAGIYRLERNAAILDYFKAGTEIRKAEKVLSENFGGSIPISIEVKGDMQDPKVLKAMNNMAKFLEEQPMVNNTQSIADLIEEMNYVMGEGKRVPGTRDKVVNLCFLLEGEEIMDQLVNSDYSEGLISATCGNLSTRKVHSLVASINDYIRKTDTSICMFKQSGLHLIYRNLDDSIINTLYQSLILSLFLILLCLLMLLKSFKGSIFGCIPIIFTLLVIFGTMGWTGLSLDVVTVLIGSVSIGIGVDYAIHFANRLRGELTQGKSLFEGVKKTIETTGKAIAINMITVACGFLVLVFADLVPLQQFGVLVALTMLSSGISTMTLLPATLLLFRFRQKK